MIPDGVIRWLNKHGKGDLQECNWLELKKALKAANITCPLADYHLEKPKGKQGVLRSGK